MAAIITLREKIYTGHGPETLTTIKVKEVHAPDNINPKTVGYELFDGRIGFIPIQNVAGVFPLTEEESK
jgi:hypothetical protein